MPIFSVGQTGKRLDALHVEYRTVMVQARDKRHARQLLLDKGHAAVKDLRTLHWIHKEGASKQMPALPLGTVILGKWRPELDL